MASWCSPTITGKATTCGWAAGWFATPTVNEHCFSDPALERDVDWYPYCDDSTAEVVAKPSRVGSTIIMVATDAPLPPHQLERVAKRPSLALGRLGAISTTGSGDIFVAFSTAVAGHIDESNFSTGSVLPNYWLTTLFSATVQATEKAIVNAMVAANTMADASELRVLELPEEKVRGVFNDSKDGRQQ